MNVVNFGSLNIDHVYAVDHFCRAGDTFMGYFVGCLAQGMERQTAMQYASMASAISVTRPGAAASIPLMDEVRAAVEAL